MSRALYTSTNVLLVVESLHFKLEIMHLLIGRGACEPNEDFSDLFFLKRIYLHILQV